MKVLCIQGALLQNHAITELEPSDFEGMLALNNAHATETSLLDQSSLAALITIAFHARGVDGGATALLIALDQDAQYDNVNFRWFKQRYKGRSFKNFVYIDRIIVSGTAQGQGIARELYEDLFVAARHAGHRRIVCEVNLDPPNLVSDVFHAAMGFVEIGQAVLYEGRKTVRYLERTLAELPS